MYTHFHFNEKTCLRFVIVVFPDHTHLLFLQIEEYAFPAFRSRSWWEVKRTELVSAPYFMNPALTLSYFQANIFNETFCRAWFQTRSHSRVILIGGGQRSHIQNLCKLNRTSLYQSVLCIRGI